MFLIFSILSGWTSNVSLNVFEVSTLNGNDSFYFSKSNIFQQICVVENFYFIFANIVFVQFYMLKTTYIHVAYYS